MKNLSILLLFSIVFISTGFTQEIPNFYETKQSSDV